MNNKPTDAGAMTCPVKRYGHINYLVEATPQILQLYPDMTVYVKAVDFDALQAENESLAGGLRGKHELTGATYTHLVVERDGLREEVASLRATLDTARSLLWRFDHAVRNDCSRATYKPIAVEAKKFLDATVTACDKPPAGWTCSRDKGHSGPCAASMAYPPVPANRKLPVHCPQPQAHPARCGCEAQ